MKSQSAGFKDFVNRFSVLELPLDISREPVEKIAKNSDYIKETLCFKIYCHQIFCKRS